MRGQTSHRSHSTVKHDGGRCSVLPAQQKLSSLARERGVRVTWAVGHRRQEPCENVILGRGIVWIRAEFGGPRPCCAPGVPFRTDAEPQLVRACACAPANPDGRAHGPVPPPNRSPRPRRQGALRRGHPALIFAGCHCRSSLNELRKLHKEAGFDMVGKGPIVFGREYVHIWPTDTPRGRCAAAEKFGRRRHPVPDRSSVRVLACARSFGRPH